MRSTITNGLLHELALVTALLSTSGCASALPDVVARTLGCPVDRVVIVGAGESRRIGSGCGRRAEFGRHCNPTFVGGSRDCHWTADSPVTSE
jgi:hypothetical protein